MALRNILEHPDPRLQQPSVEVSLVDQGIRDLIDDLVETLHDTGGIGLAAPQIGVHQRVLVMDHSGNGSAPEVYVNPEVIEAYTPGLVEESCLSVPGVVGNVVRPTQAVVRAMDESGEWFERRLEGMPAVCLHHELDHLDGRLFIERLSLFRRLWLRAASNRLARAG